MNISFHGFWPNEYLSDIRRVAEERGHTVVEMDYPAKTVVVAFLKASQGDERDVKRLVEGSRVGFLIVAYAVNGTLEIMRKYFRLGAHHVIEVPYGDDGIRKMFAEIEQELGV